MKKKIAIISVLVILGSVVLCVLGILFSDPPEKGVFLAPTVMPSTLSAEELRQATATEIAQYQKIDYRELVSYPEEHIGEKVLVEGRVFNVNSTTQMQIFLEGTSDAAYIKTKESFSGIYEDDRVIVYGVIDGENCAENAFGAKICQPLIIDAIVETPPKGEEKCDPAYPDFCIPPPSPDLDCKDITEKKFKVLPPDPHGFDTDGDGIGCES